MQARCSFVFVLSALPQVQAKNKAQALLRETSKFRVDSKFSAMLTLPETCPALPVSLACPQLCCLQDSGSVGSHLSARLWHCLPPQNCWRFWLRPGTSRVAYLHFVIFSFQSYISRAQGSVRFCRADLKMVLARDGTRLSYPA